MAEKKTKDSEEMVTIRLPKDKKADKRGVYVAVNGVAMFVPRGKEVSIPKPYYEVLKNSMAAQDDTEYYIESEKAKGKINI